MQTMMKGQGTIADRSTDFEVGGAENRNNADATVSFGARGYFSYGKNDKYQVYKFTGYQDGNKAVSISGILFHLYFTRSVDRIWALDYEKGTGLYLTFSQPADKWRANGYNNDGADDVDQIPGTITVGGVYPGELQVWAKNNIFNSADWDAALSLINASQGQTGICIIGDYTDWRSYEYNEWVADAYGFKTVVSETPGINTSTAYSIKRSGQSSFTNYSFSQVRALQ